MNRYKFSDGNLCIMDSYAVPKSKFRRVLTSVKNLHSRQPIWEVRSLRSMELEWAVHNALYGLGIERSHTKDVDLNSPQKWYVKLAYTVAGHIVWPFIK